MSLTLNTNVAALTAHRNMVSTDSQMGQSLERLSTGFRINKAADNASGMTIADSLKAQSLGIGQGIQNANEGVSIVQIADGALEESINIVNTIKTKAIQAASEGQTGDTRAAIQADIDKLMEELDTIAKTTTYNGQQLLNGGFANKELQVGASANQTATINIGSALSSDTGHMSSARLALDSAQGGEVQLTITSTISGEKIELEAIQIVQDGSNNSAENGMGALADEINSQTYLTGISALAVVESTTAEPIKAGETGSDFSINGQKIGAITVKDGDEGRALLTAINDKTNVTGVTASLDTNGALTLSSTDGRAISVSGDAGGIFGSQTAEDLSTIGYISLTQAGSSQFDIEGISTTGTGEAVTLSADLTTVSENTLGADSKIASGSKLAAGSVLGGDIAVLTTDVKTTQETQLTKGSSLASASILAKGTQLGGNVQMAAVAAADIKEDMLVTAGSTLKTGSVLGKGTTITKAFTDGGITYAAGSTLTTDVTLAADLTLTGDITLKSGTSSLAADSILATGSVLGGDMTTNAKATISEDMTLMTGSTIKAGADSVMKAGSILGGLTTVDNTVTTGDAVVTYAETKVAAGSTLATDSVLAKGSVVKDSVTVGAQTLTEDMNLKAGSTLKQDTKLKAGTTINQDMILNTATGGGATTEVTVKAGTVLNMDLYVDADTTLTEEMTLTAKSELTAASKLLIDSKTAGDQNLDLGDQKNLALSDLSVMTQEDAQLAIEIADAALADLDATRSGLGSVQNQLTSTISNLSVTKTNVQAAESAIRDVDFAEETANFSKLQLLGQAGAYAMSQANASSQNVISLLK